MNTLKFLVFLLLSAIVIVLFNESVFYLSYFVLIDLGKWWVILISVLAIQILKGFISGVFIALRELISKFNSYGSLGRKFIIIPACIYSGLCFFSSIMITIEHPTLKTISLMILMGTALLVMLVNFCYTQFDTH